MPDHVTDRRVPSFWVDVVSQAVPADVPGEEWALLAPYPTLPPAEAGQREHPLREVFNGLRYLVRYGTA